MDLGVEGKTAIVTGGSRGIGRETARKLLEAGARVAICARTRDALEQTRGELQAKTGGEVAAVVADTSVGADIERLVAEATARFGGVHRRLAERRRRAAEEPLVAPDPPLRFRPPGISLGQLP